jgi:hypothetical protein
VKCMNASAVGPLPPCPLVACPDTAKPLAEKTGELENRVATDRNGWLDGWTLAGPPEAYRRHQSHRRKEREAEWEREKNTDFDCSSYHLLLVSFTTLLCSSFTHSIIHAIVSLSFPSCPTINDDRLRPRIRQTHLHETRTHEHARRNWPLPYDHTHHSSYIADRHADKQEEKRSSGDRRGGIALFHFPIANCPLRRPA